MTPAWWRKACVLSPAVLAQPTVWPTLLISLATEMLPPKVPMFLML